MLKLKNLSRNEEGAVLILFAVLLMPMMLLTAMSIDFTRANYVTTQMAYACDAAAIAAGKYNIADAQANGTLFFNANFVQNKGDVTATPTITVSSDLQYVTCTAVGTMKGSFGTIGSSNSGILTLNSAVTTTAQRITPPTEVTLVLDNTGSMSSNNKIGGLIAAANKLVTNLLPAASPNTKMSISIVPFVAAVNIGKANSGWVSTTATPNLTNFTTNTPWAGCVMTPDQGLIMDSDAPPSGTRKWPAYYATSTCTNVLDTKIVTNTCTTSSGSNNYSYTNAGGTLRQYSPPVSSVGPNVLCGLPIQPLTNNLSTLTTLINKMVPIAGGGTFGNLGLVWGWNTISPKWSGLWSGTSGPLPYGKSIKTVVFITDGGNNWTSISGKPSDIASGYGTTYASGMTSRITAGTLGSTKAGKCTSRTAIPATVNGSPMGGCRAQIDERMLDLCTKMKAEGIQIFTVGFAAGGGIDNLAIANLKTCATLPSWYFTANDNAELLSIVETITSQIQNVLIIK